MADYHKMYLHLFNEITKAINILQDAQQAAEEMFIDSDESTVSLAKAKRMLEGIQAGLEEEEQADNQLESNGTNDATPE